MAKSKKYRMKKHRKTKKRSHKQKVWNMKGCYKHNSLAKKCSVCGSSKQKGGSCGNGMCSISQNGGTFFKPASNIPGPFVGQPWTPSIEGWPGVDGIDNNRNYLADNLYPTDPQTMMKLGGKKTKLGTKYSRRNRRRGGGLIPQDLVNLGRDFSFNMGSAYNALNGYSAPVNPLPYKDQLTNSNSLLI